MTDNVTPFRRAKPNPVPLPGDATLSRHSRRAAPGAQRLAAEQNAELRAGYSAAVSRLEAERCLAGGKVVPARITIALDMRDLEGPEVDIACGGAEPDVDMWEAGLRVPSPGQVKLIAELTGFPVAFFYKPMRPGPVTGTVFLCGGRGGQILAPDVITEDGVLLHEGKPRKVRAAARTAAKGAAAEAAGQSALF